MGRIKVSSSPCKGCYTPIVGVDRCDERSSYCSVCLKERGFYDKAMEGRIERGEPIWSQT